MFSARAAARRMRIAPRASFGRRGRAPTSPSRLRVSDMRIGALRLNAAGLSTIIVLMLCFCVLDAVHTYVGGRGEGLAMSWTYIMIGVPKFWATYFAALPL